MTAGELVPTTQIIATGAAHDDWIELAHEAAIQAAMATTQPDWLSYPSVR